MSDPLLVEQLSSLPSLTAVPRAQLEWLASHGRVRRFAAGDVMFARGHPMEELFVVLSGRYSIRVERAGVRSRVKEWQAGQISGLLPFSRMTQTPGDTVAEEAVELLAVPRDVLREMVRECYEFTALCVHEMVDRARLFKSHDLQRDKMASLGRLSAGLAHELNNPASAVVRSAKELNACRAALVNASRALGTADLTGPETEALAAIEAAALRIPAGGYSPVDRADREDAFDAWLDRAGLDASSAELLADSGIGLDDLDAAARALAGPRLRVAIEYVTMTVTAMRLTAEIELASSRIQSLVAAVKTFTHMDRAPVSEAVQVGDDLTDTFTLVRAKAREKQVTLDLRVEPGLPVVQAVRGELNQVWLNLIDNAIDAAPSPGHVVVTAARDRTCLAVSVVDDGPGIAEADRDRIFEPFFTTKPVDEGTGMGLDIVLGIVHRHSGWIEVHSESGRTEFRVSLPIAGSTPAL